MIATSPSRRSALDVWRRRRSIGVLTTLAAAVLALATGCVPERTHDRVQTARDAAIGSAAPDPASLHARGPIGSPIRSRSGIGPDLSALPLLTGPFDEIWILAHDPDARGSRPVSHRTLPRPAATDGFPRTATLVAELPCEDDVPTPREPRRVPLPLAQTDIDGRVAGPIFSATMRQRYRNPFEGTIDAVYVFPLPHDAAVSDFVMVVGERRIRGLIRERGEAERIYADARRAGHAASLLTQERPNVFTQRVANLEPGHAIDIEIGFYGTLDYDDGWHELAIPLVVGPRFTPGGFAPPPERGIVARPRTGPAEGADRHEVRYLEPGETSDHRVRMRWTIDAGTALRDLTSPSHPVAVERSGDGRAIVSLSAEDGAPDRDFILRWRVGDSVPTTSLVSSLGSGQPGSAGHFVLTVYPPVDVAAGEPVPMETILVIDRSGSMRGVALAQAKEMATTIIDRLGPSDTFSIVEFSNTAAAFSDRPVVATADAKRRGRRYVESLEAGGGTHMIPGMQAALSMSGDESRQRHVILLTDGYIGNEVEVLATVSRLRGSARISTVGSGSAVNRFLIAAMSQIGHGTSGVLLPQESARDAADALIDRLRHPVIAAPTIAADGLVIDGVFPATLPDLHAGRPLTVIGRTAHRGPATLSLDGWVGGQRIRVPLTVDFDGSADATALDRLWARAAIADLSRRGWTGEINDAPQRIREVALRHGLLSLYTAFVAVDASRTIDGSIERHGIVTQAVPVPDGVDFDATVPPPPTVR